MKYINLQSLALLFQLYFLNLLKFILNHIIIINDEIQIYFFIIEVFICIIIHFKKYFLIITKFLNFSNQFQILKFLYYKLNLFIQHLLLLFNLTKFILILLYFINLKANSLNY